MPLFTKGAPMQLGALPMEKFPLPELGKDVYAFVRGLTALEGTVLKAAAKKKEDLDANDLRALKSVNLGPEEPLTDFRFLSWILVNPDGTPVFTETRTEDGQVVKSAEDDVRDHFNVMQSSIMGILEAGLRISGLKDKKEKN